MFCSPYMKGDNCTFVYCKQFMDEVYSLIQLSSREALIMKRTQMRSELTWQLSRLQSAKDDLDKMKNVNQLKGGYCSIEKHYICFVKPSYHS